MNKILDFLCPFIIIGGLLFIIIGIPVMADSQEKNDYRQHAIHIGDSILLVNDTVTVLDWRTGRFNTNRGYILSNGLTVDELIVKKNLLYKN